MTYRACVVTSPENVKRWDEVQADSFTALLDELRKYGSPFRVLIYRVVRRYG